jgi:hypothetical protein
MSNEVTNHEPADDGFHGSLNSGRYDKGTIAKWSDTEHWRDRDGLPLPSPLLVIAINEVVRRWKDGKPEIIGTKPLPDPEALNAAIPVTEWEIGLDGKPAKPWNHTVYVYLVNLSTGELFTYSSHTMGAHIAYDQLREQVLIVRAIRGECVMPMVKPDEKPMKTKFGMNRRPHFEIVGWKAPGGDSNKVVPPVKPTPQLPSSATPPAETPAATEKPAAAPATPPRAAAAPAPPATSSSEQAKAKPLVKLMASTYIAHHALSLATLPRPGPGSSTCTGSFRRKPTTSCAGWRSGCSARPTRSTTLWFLVARKASAKTRCSSRSSTPSVLGTFMTCRRPTYSDNLTVSPSR